MNATINPELRELQQKVEEMRIDLAKTQGEIGIIRFNSERNDRQTNKQFVIFTITMLIAVVTCLVGTSIFQTEALRREMDLKFAAVSQRMEAIEKRMDTLEKRMERMEQSLDEIKREIRARR